MLIDTIYFEGPTCSGKSTMMRALNKRTNYEWTLVDRGHLSGYIEAQRQDRDNVHIRYTALKRVLALPGTLIVLMGEGGFNWPQTKKRFLERGDDVIQDVSELKEEFDLWCNLVKEFTDHPRVIWASSVQNLEQTIRTKQKLLVDARHKKHAATPEFNALYPHTVDASLQRYEDGSLYSIK